MSAAFWLIVTCALTAGGEQVIDSCDYSNDTAARQAWKADAGDAAVQTVRDGTRGVLQVQAPFASDREIPRISLDRSVALNLAAPGEFVLRLMVDRPEAAGQVSLYFRSGDGWYSGGGGLQRTGWNTLRFSKAAFRAEGEPAGWDKIDGIRISCWRGKPADIVVRVGGLSAHWRSVAVVVPSGKNGAAGGELASARGASETVSGLLEELGLGCDAIEESSLSAATLGNRRVAIVAYHPHLSDEATDTLVSFVERGGKVMLCYLAPPRLAEALGIGTLKYFRPEKTGGLAEIHFDVPAPPAPLAVPGLPKSVHQASWNITTAEPAGHNARVIGRWFDDQGQPTGHAAMLLSDTGSFFSHIVLGDDRPGKRQMLAAVLGRLEPTLWQEMARSQLERTDHVGHLEGLAEIGKHVKSVGDEQALKVLADAQKVVAEADVTNRGDPVSGSEVALRGAKTVELATRARGLLAEAYLRSQPSPAKEGRAFWNHSGTGAYDGDWDRTARELAAGGFNMVVPNMLWAGVAHYASDILPRSRTFEKHGDQIAQCVAACQQHGIEVHVWKVNYNLSGAPAEFVAQLRRDGRTQVTAEGKPHDWLCPSHADNLKLEVDSLVEVARKYDIAGLHFDYIRYPDGNCCYCDGCRKRFQEASGRTVVKWPDDCYRGSLREVYRDWRCQQITRLVAAVHREAKRLRPTIKISAAVFGAYPDCRQSVGQDWVAWVEAGLLDFVCPMDYSESDLQFRALVSNQLRLVGGRIPVYPGIGATASHMGLTPDRVVGQIHWARTLGANGFTVFNLQPDTAREILPGVALSAGRTPAKPPHNR